MFLEAATHSLKSKRYIQKQLHKLFTVYVQNIHILCEDFQNLSVIMKTFMMVIKPKVLHIPGRCCYSTGLHKPLIIVSVQGYVMLINRVLLMLLILKQHLLSIYRFINK